MFEQEMGWDLGKVELEGECLVNLIFEQTCTHFVYK